MNRELRQALEASAEGRAYLARQKSAKRARARRVGAKPAVKERRAETAAEFDARMARLARIRSDLFMETGGTCAACIRAITMATMEAHHLIRGRGKRRTYEDQSTMAPTCGRCHDLDHDENDLDTLEALRGWCLRTGRSLAAAALARRIDKIAEARASVGGGGRRG